jgi:hypothetical protein
MMAAMPKGTSKGVSGIHYPRRNRNAGFSLFSNWRWMAADDGCAVSDDGCADGIQTSHVALWMAAPSPMAMASSTRRRWRWKVELSAAPAADGIQTRQGVFVGSSWFPGLAAAASGVGCADGDGRRPSLTLPPSLTAASVPF